MAGFQCVDWQLKSVSGGRITLNSVAVSGAFSTKERLEWLRAQTAVQPQRARASSRPN